VSRAAPLREDPRFVTGRGRYAADITPAGTLHIGLVTSPHAHARIEAITVEEALRVDGVVAVLTGAELAKETAPLRQYLDTPDIEWRPLAVEETRYAGEWVPLWLPPRGEAEDGAELVEVDYEPLPAILDPEGRHQTGCAARARRAWHERDDPPEFAWGDVGGRSHPLGRVVEGPGALEPQTPPCRWKTFG